MSKVDAMRALREARMSRAASVPKVASAPKVARQAAPPARVAPVPVERDETTCGHRSMNGRTCIRPSGHAEKNHRYG